MRRSSLTLLLLPLLALGLSSLAQAQVYQWKDANGTVHFADTPPSAGTTYKSVRISTSSGHSQSAAPTVDADTADADLDAPTDAKAVNRKDVCTRLQTNIKVLQNPKPVLIAGADGKQSVMTATQRQQELSKEQAQYRQYCAG